MHRIFAISILFCILLHQLCALFQIVFIIKVVIIVIGERENELKSVGFFTVDTNKLVCGVKLRMLLENTLRHAVFGQIAVYVVEAVGN